MLERLEYNNVPGFSLVKERVYFRGDFMKKMIHLTQNVEVTLGNMENVVGNYVTNSYNLDFLKISLLKLCILSADTYVIFEVYLLRK